MTKILFESTKYLIKKLYIPKILRIEHLAHAFYCFKNCNQKKLFEGEVLNMYEATQRRLKIE